MIKYVFLKYIMDEFGEAPWEEYLVQLQFLSLV